MSNRQSYKFKYNKKNPVLIQFVANSKKELEAMNKHLEKSNIKILRKSEKRSYGTITNFLDPDGNVLEILLPNNN
ncbi:MAG: VOC family protein [Candidatus Aenigmarchaeota archaeon]|nr:VOC family protein [Candidatus Aenigmarchaeota archaeon]